MLAREYAIAMATVIGYETAAACWISGFFDGACVPANLFSGEPILGHDKLVFWSSLLASDRLDVDYRASLAFGREASTADSNKREARNSHVNGTVEEAVVFALGEALAREQETSPQKAPIPLMYPTACDDPESFKLSVGRLRRLRRVLQGALGPIAGSNVHVLVPRSKERTWLEGSKSHVHANELPLGSLVRLQDGEDLFAVSPELAFFQMAQKLEEPKLVQLGCELCGTYFYRLGEPEGAGMGFRQLALTTPPQLARFLESCGSGKQGTLARRAAELVVEGAHSPMETVLALVLSLPVRLGGYNLPKPKLNHPVALRDSRTGRQAIRYVDLCWPESRLAVEYYGEAYHEEEKRYIADSFRQNDLVREGWTLLVVTKEHFALLERLDTVAAQIARQVGCQIRWSRLKPFRDRRRLVSSLMEGSSLSALRL